jgi:hypothetical protein
MTGLRRPFFAFAARNVHWLILAAVLLAVLTSFYRYGVVRAYTIILEAPCDPTRTECYARDCAEPGSCPPDNLSAYQLYALPASLFDQCDSNYCLSLCKESGTACRPMPCGDQTEVECEGPNHSA